MERLLRVGPSDVRGRAGLKYPGYGRALEGSGSPKLQAER